MRLFTQHLHLPAPSPASMPPPCMWQELRDRLDRLSLSSHRLRLEGTVEGLANGRECSLHVVINGELHRVFDIAPTGRFRLDLPNDERVRLVFVSTGHLPRIVELRPTSTGTEEIQRMNLHVALTPNGMLGGSRNEPMRERITLGRAGVPHMVEYDRTPRSSHEAAPLPSLKRAS